MVHTIFECKLSLLDTQSPQGALKDLKVPKVSPQSDLSPKNNQGILILELPLFLPPSVGYVFYLI